MYLEDLWIQIYAHFVEKTDCERTPNSRMPGYDLIRCSRGYTFSIEDSSVEYGSAEEVQQKFNLLALRLLDSKLYGNTYYCFYFDDRPGAETIDIFIVKIAAMNTLLSTKESMP